jgi:hypothetical protein
MYSAFSAVMSGPDHYDHPILLLQHMLWHEGYHHGQISLALTAALRSRNSTVSRASRFRLAGKGRPGWQGRR